MMEAGACAAADAPKRSGVVMRIAGADYVASFLIRDARKGAIILTRSSDPRIGADYSSDRGARALIRDKLRPPGLKERESFECAHVSITALAHPC